MRPSAGGRRLVLTCLVAALTVAPARAADVAAPDPAVARDLATLSARETLLGEQAGTARASARWRLGALYRLAVVSPELPPAARARAVDAAARAFARALAEERSLAQENTRAHADRVSRTDVGGVEIAIGAAPAFAAPTSGAVLARFGVGPDRDTGLLVWRAGVRLAAQPGQAVSAPAAGTIVSASEGAVMLEHGEGWTTIIGGLATLTEEEEGLTVAAGQPLGTAVGGPAGVTFEVWRGRRPVDPLLLLRRASRPLAAVAPLP